MSAIVVVCQYFNPNHFSLSSEGVTPGYQDQIFVRIRPVTLNVLL
jgi:hypothetical protein